ncbi:NADP-dependent glyceraldehyde-3-phosphate dehydrogenase [Clostridium polyendosporum]|uniref:NADP-dependent glyceraldehyde-3-phosphate dehydrogenase n=1 Tax=Clostridium polyendosporum TaxID=69208 RepID=A0A919S1V6_9CLOT|nr:NADP-dependent glyceraldehyde-3-phosphate dehydrogenase [Clostridium polyendosporum]GIM30324.1 NADP-dependent glyceraldehyde-3-phosphate dehydrogenase [Clostridium polyendosporum]
MFSKIKKDELYQNVYNGIWGGIKTDENIPIYAPLDNSFIGYIQKYSKNDVDRTIDNSKKTQVAWSETPINERAAILHKAATILEDHKEYLAELLCKEICKDKKSSLSEIQRTADFIRFTADEGKHLYGTAISSDSFPGYKKDKLSFATYVPLGVVLAISPFNYPINLSASKIAPALIAGNSVVFKPPTQGSISALHLAQIFNEAGIPPGILNTITGSSSEIGDYLVTHPSINFINFTGSTKIGRHIAKIAEMVPLLMELGGKDAAIVLEDADLEDASSDIVSGAFSYSGQRCTAVKRVLVMETVADALSEMIRKKVEELKVGSPFEDVQITPLIDNKAADFVQELIDDAVQKGGKLLIGNKREGNLIYPTLFDYVTKDMRLAWEEPFGPVLPIMRVKTIQEAIDIANRSEYGLQSSVFTKNIDKAFYIASKLDVGTVQINNRTERGPDHFPFLGVKSSGLGTQGISYSIKAMSRPKAIVLNFENKIE